MGDILIKILVCLIAGAGAGIGTGFAGMSAAAVIGPMLITFLGVPAYDAVGIGLVSDVLASLVSAYTYKKSGNLDVKNSLPLLISVLSVTIIVSIVNAMGGDNAAPAAGYGIVNRINGFAMLPAISFAMAMAAITAQNMGANKPIRAQRTLVLAITCTMALGLVFLLLLQLFPENMVALFIDRKSAGAEEVIRNGALYARSFSWDYILVPIIFCTNGFFNGCGKTFFTMGSNLFCTFFVRIPVSYACSIMTGATLYHVGLAAPLASVLGCGIAIYYLLSGRWRNRKKI